jgi:predicted DNA-binding transcriptional regulator AlpA
MTLVEEIMQVAFTAPDERKRDALRVLKGEVEAGDADALRRCSGQAEPYLTMRMLSKRLGISGCSLWRYGVPGHELGGRRRFRMSEVEAYLASEEFKARAEDLKEERREQREGATRNAECGVRNAGD